METVVSMGHFILRNALSPKMSSKRRKLSESGMPQAVSIAVEDEEDAVEPEMTQVVSIAVEDEDDLVEPETLQAVSAYAEEYILEPVEVAYDDVKCAFSRTRL